MPSDLRRALGREQHWKVGEVLLRVKSPQPQFRKDLRSEGEAWLVKS